MTIAPGQKQWTWLGALLAFAVTSFILLNPGHSLAQYVANNLIADNIFLNSSSMTESQIQTFLTNRGGYLASYTTFSSRDNATVPAAQIIYEAAQDYGINPQVILATLQKEQSLVTDPSPLSSQLTFAMGYGCGDSSGCSQYSGFFNQVDNATWQLRFDFERASGNNTWWNASLGYPCVTPSAAPPYHYSGNNNPHYYYPGLMTGNNVTFYDGYGTGYQTFTLNDNATSALYCYTPHAYAGSSADYYSGSYNFVASFEQWFGSTQPTIVVSTPLQVTDLSQGMYTNSQVTASFTLTNTSNQAINVGDMAVTVRDQNDNNSDYGLEQMTIPANSSMTYSMSQDFTTPGTYTFTISNDQNGVWSNSYPASSLIDNPRVVTDTIQAMPTVTVQPSTTVSANNMRQGHAMPFTFTVTNGSSTTPINLGYIGLAVRAPNGSNADLPTVNETIPAGGSYTYSESLMPEQTGTYTAWIIDSTNNGGTWNGTNFPASGAGVQRQINFNVGPSPTITQGPALSVGSPHVGQSVNATFVIHNYGDQAVAGGWVGMAIRDPNGNNVGLALESLNVASASDMDYSQSTIFNTPGTYTAWITYTPNETTWDNSVYPALDSGSVQRMITFTVLPNPTITVQPTITTTDPRVGKALSATFTVHNYGSNTVNLGLVSLAARDPQGRNVDFGLQSVSVPAGGNYVYTSTNPGTLYQNPGTYTSWVTLTQDNGKTWINSGYPAPDSNSIQRQINFNVGPSPTITQGPALSVGSPHVGQSVNATFVIHNYGDQAVAGGWVGMAIRDPNGNNVGLALESLNVASASDMDYSQSTIFNTPGTYTAWITYTPNETTWDNSVYPALDSGSVQRMITFTVLP